LQGTLGIKLCKFLMLYQIPSFLYDLLLKIIDQTYALVNSDYVNKICWYFSVIPGWQHLQDVDHQSWNKMWKPKLRKLEYQCEIQDHSHER
jgi:hypothetical protein